MTPVYVGVHILDAPPGLDREYTYRADSNTAQAMRPGCFVGVPFGGANRTRIGIVTRVSDAWPFDADDEAAPKEGSVKDIIAPCGENVSLSDELMGVFGYLRSQTLCTAGDAVHAMVPAGALSALGEYWLPVPDAAVSGKDPQAASVYEYILSRGRVSTDALKSRFGADVLPALKKLRSRGCIKSMLEIRESKPKTETVWSLPENKTPVTSALDGQPVGEGKGRRPIRSEGQLAALSALVNAGRPMLNAELTGIPGVTRENLDALLKKQLVVRSEYDVNRNAGVINRLEYKDGNPGPITLNTEQGEAFRKLTELSEDGKPHGVLLEGVTGSGKTCVMLRIIDETLKKGRGVILLLPEIALTPQSLAIFCSRYGDRVAVMHSALSAGERNDAYLRIKSGEADLVIGTRSAVFAPVKNPGLIILDEEQEHTYKSDSSPRYHARDIARFRCAYSNAVMLLASATPSLESRYKAETGAYTLIRMTQRYGNSVLPKVTVADMRLEPTSGNLSPIGSLLAQKLRETYERKEQSVLFLNRRGYNSYVSCASCGEAVSCPQCSVSMTYHVRRGSYSDGELVCHWCGRRMPLPKACPTCGSEHMIRMGYGTQRVQQELEQLIPGVRVLRMDTDSASTKDAYDRMLGSFRSHGADILLGTQMVTKGHDFPDVTLVGVLLADASLYYDDYRASERTFALLTQVIGRAGRRDTPGEAVIQTNNPGHEIIALAGAQDYETMYRREIRLRKQLVFPPFCDIAMVTVTCQDEKNVLAAASAVNAYLKSRSAEDEFKGLPFIIFGPFEAPVYRVDGRYRMRLVIKCRLVSGTRRLFAGLLENFRCRDDKSPAVSVDFNPTSL